MIHVSKHSSRTRDVFLFLGPLKKATDCHCHLILHKRTRHYAFCILNKLIPSHCHEPNVVVTVFLQYHTVVTNRQILYMNPPPGWLASKKSYHTSINTMSKVVVRVRLAWLGGEIQFFMSYDLHAIESAL